MTWLRLDDGFTSNAKVAQLTDAEFRVWLRLLCYCARVQDPTVDGVTRREVSGLNAPRTRRFFELRLLDLISSDAQGSYEVHDWEKYLPRDATNHERQARWRARKAVTNTVTDTVTPPVTETALEPLRDPRAPARTPAAGPSRTSPEEQDQQAPKLTTPNGQHADQAIRAEALASLAAATGEDDDIPF